MAGGRSSSPAAADVEALQCRPQVGYQGGERPLQRCLSADNHEIVSFLRLNRHDLFDDGAQTAACPVAGNGVTNLATDRETDTYGRLVPSGGVAGAMASDLEDQAGSDPLAPRPRDLEELRAPLQASDFGDHNGVQAERRLRPLARRLARTRRPPTVAMRLRKP